MQDILETTEQRSDKYRQNWSENIQFSSHGVLHPETVREVMMIVKDKQYRHVKVIGTRHCFGTIADTRAAPESKDDRTVHICTEKLVSTQFSTAQVQGYDAP